MIRAIEPPLVPIEFEGEAELSDNAIEALASLLLALAESDGGNG